MDVEQIFRRNADWVRAHLAKDPAYFDKMSQGQTPEFLYIGCADSRVTAEGLMGLKPGDAFIHRNIANLVSAMDLGAMSSIEYAVTHLKVQHVVVCGHYNCGGVQAAMRAADMGVLNPWLRQIRDVYRIHQDELDAIEDDSARYDRLVELNVQEQCVNVIKTSAVQEAWLRDHKIQVHGWVFNMRNGELIDLKIDFPTILNRIMRIYRLAPT